MRRILTVALLEVRTARRRPSVWVLLSILLLLSWMVAADPISSLGSGASSAGGEREFMNSEISLTHGAMLYFTLLYVFFAGLAFGNATIDDDALRVMPLVGSTGLTPAEYIVGRWLGIAIVFSVILVVDLLMTIGFTELYPVEEPDKVRGAFVLLNYLRPMIVFQLLPTLCLGAVALAIGAVTRSSAIVFALPMVVALTSLVLVPMSAAVLPVWADPVLQAVDISGRHWLTSTYLAVDRGVAYYNMQAVGWDAMMIGQRVALMLIGVGGLWIAAASESRRVRAPFAVSASERARAIAALDRTQTVRERPTQFDAPLASLNMGHSSPSALATAIHTFCAEVCELRRSVVLWVFGLFVGIMCLVVSLSAPSSGYARLTSVGTFFMGSEVYDILSSCSVLLLLYYFTESLARDDRSRISSMVSASPARLAPMMIGRMAACALVVVGTVMLSAWGALVIIVVGKYLRSNIFLPPSLSPFLLAVGVLMSATIFVWMSFLALVWSLFRNRYAVYGMGIGVILIDEWVPGGMNWVRNWSLYDGVRWTDFGALELDREALVVNRILWTLVGLTLLHASIEFGRRRTPDAHGIAARLHWSRAWRRAARLLVFGGPAIVCGVALALMVRAGPSGGLVESQERQYFVGNDRTWRDAPQPTLVDVTLELYLDPAAHQIRVKGSYRLKNETAVPLTQFAVTPGHAYQDLAFVFEGQRWTPDRALDERRKNPRSQRVANSSGLWVFTPTVPIQPGDAIDLGFQHLAYVPAGTAQNLGGADEFILPAGVVLNSFGASFLPAVGYTDSHGEAEPKRHGPEDWKLLTKPIFGSGGHTRLKAVIRLPAGYRANMPGECTIDSVADGVRTQHWESDHPIGSINLVAGRWRESRGTKTSIWHLPEHDFNIKSMLEALDGAREWYSKWYWPYPWKELRLSEFPGLGDYAQGFSTNIVFSETMGFMSMPTQDYDSPFEITAHEVAHQWWGGILVPGDAPGGNILSEGMAEWSALRLVEKLRGEWSRMMYLRRMEIEYGEDRQPDDERPLVEVDGSRAGDQTVTYNKGGWVFWMLMNLIGEDRMDAAMHEFIGKFKDNPDHPLLQDFIEVVRTHAPDSALYDRFVQQWFFEVVVPEFRVGTPIVTSPSAAGDLWSTTFTVENIGTGTVQLEVEVTDDAVDRPKDMFAWAVHEVSAGRSVEYIIKSTFKPTRVVADPDYQTLMLNRYHAEAKVE